jgi:hypothetical protein
MRTTAWRKRMGPQLPDPINAFRTGNATLTDWNALAAVSDAVEAMASAGLGAEGMSICMQAREHLENTMDRFERIGRMGATGPALQVWEQLTEHYELQQQERKKLEAS